MKIIQTLACLLFLLLSLNSYAGPININTADAQTLAQGIDGVGEKRAQAIVDYRNEHGAFAARGVHGQTIYVDPAAEMVIVRFASFPTAKNAKIDPTSLPAYEAVAEYLMKKG